MDFNLELRLGASSPFGSIDLIALNSLDTAIPSCDGSTGLLIPLPPLGRFIAGGLAGKGSPFDGVEVIRNEAGSMDEAAGMKAEMIFGRGRRVGAGTDECSLMLMMGKVLSPGMAGVLSVNQYTHSRIPVVSHSQALIFPFIPNLEIPFTAWTTSGVKKPPPPFARGLSCLR